MNEQAKFQIADYFGIDAQENQLIEEMAELTQAIFKRKRGCGFGQPLASKVSLQEIENNVVEELADVKLVLEQVIYLLRCEGSVQETVNRKIERTLGRIQEADKAV